MALKGALAKGKGRGRGGGKAPDAPEDDKGVTTRKAKGNTHAADESRAEEETQGETHDAKKRKKAIMPDANNETPQELSSKKKKKKTTCETADESPDASVNTDGTEHQTPETKTKKKKKTCETAESPVGTEEQTTETKKKKKKNTCEAGEGPVGTEEQTTETKKNKKKNACEAGDTDETKEQQTETKKKKKTCEAEENPDATVKTASDQKKKKHQKKATEATTAEPDNEAPVYPESASERRKLKAQAAADVEASCTANGFVQSRLEDLKHVIRTPRQYPPASTRDTRAEKKQLNIGHFIAKQEVEEKPKAKKAKNATPPATGLGFSCISVM